MAGTVTILGTDVMEITPDPVASNASELIPKKHVVAVFPAKFQQRQPGDTQWTYPFDTITVLVFCLVDGRKINLELQTVSNQPGWNDGSLSALNNAHDDVRVWLNGGSLAPGPAILVNPSSLTMDDTIITLISAAKTITVSGSNLTNDIVIPSLPGFIINLDGSTTDATPLTIPHVAGTVAPTTVHIRFNPTAIQSWNSVLQITSTGATTQNVSISATVLEPTISIAPASITFEDTELDFTSDAQSFMISAVNLHSNLSIAGLVGFIINQDGSEVDAGPIVLVPLAGVVAPTQIFVRFIPVDIGPAAGNIVASSMDAANKNVAVSGLALFPENRVYSYYHNV